MTWAAWLTISVLSGASGILYQRYSLRDEEFDSTGFAVATGVLASVLIGVYLLIFGFDTRFDLLVWPNAALMPFMWLAVDVLGYRAVQITPAGVYNVLFATRAFWGVVVAMIVFNESGSLGLGLGFVLLLVASIIVGYQKESTWTRTGVILSLLTAFFSGAAVVNDSVATRNGFDEATYYLFGFLLPAILMYLFVRGGRTGAQYVKNHWRTIGILSVFWVVSATTLLLALNVEQDASVVLSVNQVQTPLIALGAFVLLKEKNRIRMIALATGLAFIGVLLATN